MPFYVDITPNYGPGFFLKVGFLISVHHMTSSSKKTFYGNTKTDRVFLQGERGKGGGVRGREPEGGRGNPSHPLSPENS